MDYYIVSDGSAFPNYAVMKDGKVVAGPFRTREAAEAYIKTLTGSRD